MDLVEIICGIDEAGRGPLAGPVVAAAVVLDKKRRINGLNDSKQLTEGRRDILTARIKERAIAWVSMPLPPRGCIAPLWCIIAYQPK